MEGVLRASHAGHSKHTLALSCTHTPNISSTHAFPQGYQLRHCYNKQKGIYNDAIQGTVKPLSFDISRIREHIVFLQQLTGEL